MGREVESLSTDSLPSLEPLKITNTNLTLDNSARPPPSIQDSDSDENFQDGNDSDEWWENTETIRAKSIYDGCKNIDEIVRRLNSEIEKFCNLKNQGWELIDVVEDDYGHIRKQT